MKVEISITIIRTEQPSEAVWKQLQRFAMNWNINHAHHFMESLGIFLDLKFDDCAHPEQREISAVIKKLQADLQIQVHIVRQTIYDVADYATADFVEINGVGLAEGLGSHLVTNASQVLASQPCPQCGYCGPFDQVQNGLFAINERLLDCLAVDGTPPPLQDWDFIEIDAGHKLISSRFAEVLADQHIEGYTLDPVLIGYNGQPSKRIWQLRAIQTIICPCSEHTRAIDGYFCPTCGVAHCDLEDEDWLRDEWIGGNEIFSRHRNHGAIIYVSGRVQIIGRSWFTAD